MLVAASAIAQGFLQYTRLGIGAVQHGIVLITVALACLERSNLVSDDIGFFIVAIALNHGNLITDSILAEQVLGDLSVVFLNEAVGRFSDILGRAVVAFKFKCLDVRIKPL